MGVALRRFQLLRQCGFLLAEVVFRCITRTQIGLKLALGGPHFAYFCGLSGELPSKICDHLVALSDFCTSNLLVMASIAQSFFKRGLSAIGLRLAWLWLGRFHGVSPSMRADTVSEETNSDNDQNARITQHPDVPPRGLSRKCRDATQQMQRTILAIGPVLLHTAQALE